MANIKIVTEEDLDNTFLQNSSTGVSVNIDNKTVKKDSNGVIYTNSNSIFLECGENLSTGSLVTVIDGLIYKYNNSNTSQLDKAIGFANSHGLVGETIEIITNGGMCEALSGLSSGSKYYAGVDGAITTIPPTVGVRQVVAYAISSEKFICNIQDGVIKIA